MHVLLLQLDVVSFLILSIFQVYILHTIAQKCVGINIYFSNSLTLLCNCRPGSRASQGSVAEVVSEVTKRALQEVILYNSFDVYICSL